MSIAPPGTRFVSRFCEVCIVYRRGFYLWSTRDVSFDTRFWSLFSYRNQMIYEANVSILPSKNDEKPGTKFWKSTGNFAKRFQFKNILTMKKWAVPVYIRGFDSFEPPMSRFCLWKAASFTRFWSLQLPFLAWFKRFWSRIFSQGDLIYEVLISGKTIYILYI